MFKNFLSGKKPRSMFCVLSFGLHYIEDGPIGELV